MELEPLWVTLEERDRRRLGLEKADGCDTNSGGVRKLLLTPIKKSPSCSALGRRQHACGYGAFT